LEELVQVIRHLARPIRRALAAQLDYELEMGIYELVGEDGINDEQLTEAFIRLNQALRNALREGDA
jgi:hypothetical protein